MFAEPPPAAARRGRLEAVLKPRCVTFAMIMTSRGAADAWAFGHQLYRLSGGTLTASARTADAVLDTAT
jgi:hypothetical protein